MAFSWNKLGVCEKKLQSDVEHFELKEDFLHYLEVSMSSSEQNF